MVCAISLPRHPICIFMNLFHFCLWLRNEKYIAVMLLYKEYGAKSENYIQKWRKTKEICELYKSRFMTSISWWLKLNDIIMPYYKSYAHTLKHTCGYRIAKCNTQTPCHCHPCRHCTTVRKSELAKIMLSNTKWFSMQKNFKLVELDMGLLLKTDIKRRRNKGVWNR